MTAPVGRGKYDAAETAAVRRAAFAATPARLAVRQRMFVMQPVWTSKWLSIVEAPAAETRLERRHTPSSGLPSATISGRWPAIKESPGVTVAAPRT
jgi:hypothetical protein